MSPQLALTGGPFGSAYSRNRKYCGPPGPLVESPRLTHETLNGGIRRTGVTEYWRSGIPLVDFDIGRPDYLAPLLGFGGDEFSEIGGRARKRRRTQIGEPRFYLGFGKSNVYLLVQFVDDFGGCVL